jgi:hypothetical protein
MGALYRQLQERAATRLALSRFQLGDPVVLNCAQAGQVRGYIRATTFTEGKVRYSLYVQLAPDDWTSLHNVDSALVFSDSSRSRLNTLPFDNFS